MRNISLLLLLFITLACAQDRKPLQGETAWQLKMNADFKDASKSPLKKKDLERFEGLDFFKFDSTFVVNAILERTPNTEYFKMKTTTDRFSEERVFGVLHFEINGEKFKLNVYQNKEAPTTDGFEDYLFLPFLDATNGETTYGGGRYIDLRIPEGDQMVIDFNQAYNPYCVYNERFSCPIVPRVNYLTIEINAGIKDFKQD